jgi:hypothetical protein
MSFSYLCCSGNYHSKSFLFPDSLSLKGLKGSLLLVSWKVNYFNRRCFTISDFVTVSWDILRQFNTSTRGTVGASTSEPTGAVNYSYRGFRCTQCFRVYRHRSNLLRHIRLECGKDPIFQCPYCQHRSKRKGNLMMHIRKLHQQDVEKLEV